MLNYARFYLHQALPDLDKMIYLDTDVIVQGNIAELWSIAKLDQKIIACVPWGLDLTIILEPSIGTRRHSRTLTSANGFLTPACT